VSSEVGRCEVTRLRHRVIIPLTGLTLICQLGVIIDDVWGWANISRKLKIKILPRSNLVTPMSSGDLPMGITAEPSKPTQQPDHPSCVLNVGD